MITTTRTKYLDMVVEQAKDLHIRSYVVYGDLTDHKIYREATGDTKTQITQAEIEDMFPKQAVLVKVGDVFYAPVAINGNKLLTIAKTGEPTEEFDATKTYNVGDVVTKGGKSYKCKTQISVAAAWDATKWDEITTVDFVEWTAKATA